MIKFASHHSLDVSMSRCIDVSMFISLLLVAVRFFISHSVDITYLIMTVIVIGTAEYFRYNKNRSRYLNLSSARLNLCVVKSLTHTNDLSE